MANSNKNGQEDGERMGGPAASMMNVTGALNEAQRIIREAEARAEQIINEARDQAQKHHHRGYEEGISLAKQEVWQQAVRLIIDGGRVRSLVAEEAASLSVAICEKVIGEHLKVDISLVKNIALSALRNVPMATGQSLKLLCNPDDLSLLERSLPELERLANGEVILVGETHISRGGCIVKCILGEVDAQIESLIKAVAYHLGISGGQDK